MKIRFRRECTPLSARWCPTHGTCECTQLNEHGSRIWDDSMDHLGCPLHSPRSTHPLKVKRTVVSVRRTKGVRWKA